MVFPVAMRVCATPVPIPNTMVKTDAADDTVLETIWESRWLPETSVFIGKWYYDLCRMNFHPARRKRKPWWFYGDR